MRKPQRSICLFTALWLGACASGTQPPLPPPPPPPPPAAPEPTPAAPNPPAPEARAATTAVEVVKPPHPEPVVRYEGFSTPESVLWDETHDRYLVSNINGDPSKADGNGFISAVSPDGTVTALRWIEGGRNKAKLDAPKGLGIAKGTLYVADITSVRMFDLESAAPRGEVKIPGATFLNDIAVAPDGRVFVSDSGMKSGPKGFERTGTDAVWVIEKGKARALAKSKDLGQPNGLLFADGKVLVVTFGSGELYSLDEKGMKGDVSKLGESSLDGLVSTGEDLLISDWATSAVHRGKVGEPFGVVLTDQKSPADLGFDRKRGRVLVPHFLMNTVEAYELK